MPNGKWLNTKVPWDRPEAKLWIPTIRGSCVCGSGMVTGGEFRRKAGSSRFSIHGGSSVRPTKVPAGVQWKSSMTQTVSNIAKIGFGEQQSTMASQTLRIVFVPAERPGKDRAAVIEEDLRTLDTAEWCERYDVPLSFVDEDE